MNNNQNVHQPGSCDASAFTELELCSAYADGNTLF